MTATFAFAVGVRNTNHTGLVLDCLYPASRAPQRCHRGCRCGLVAGIHALSDSQLQMLILLRPNSLPASLVTAQRDCNNQHELIAIRLTADKDIASTEEAYLKLHLLSHRLALPNTLNLGGIFNHMPAWTWLGRLKSPGFLRRC